jgi:protease-4
MRKLLFKTTLITLTFLPLIILGQAIPGYYDRYPVLLAPATTFQEGLVGFVNPANLKMIHGHESRFYWNTDEYKSSGITDWGFFTAVKSLSFGMFRQNLYDNNKVTDYRISTGFGTDKFAAGLGYGWSSGIMNAMGRENILTTGGIYRPFRFLSVGLLGNWSVKSSAKEGVLDIGIRPFGSDILTFFADGAIQKGEKITNAPWSTGASFRLVKGINITGRTFENETYTVGITINLGRPGISSQLYYNKENEHTHNSYMVRIGGRQPSIFNTLFQKNKRYYKADLKGTVRYQKYIWFDKNTHRLFDILKNIEAVIDDPRVGVIALNLSSMRVLPEHAWEIRQILKKAQNRNKKVIVFIDRAGMTNYHLASIADLVVMDPEGNLMLPGYLLGRTYFKGTLEKVGLGFDEWRFFEYKSAAEVLSRDKMSKADSTQTQNYVDDWYEFVRNDICESRNLSEAIYDNIIDNEVYFLAEEALQIGLVDTLARWSELNKIIKNIAGKKMWKISTNNLLQNSLPSEQWGEKPQIVIVYGLGECSMDSGIKARWLERVFLKLAKKKQVKAVVFRVDSPGGDGLASDVVAQAIKVCSKEKPVIVSQGQVAGSGGYWISIYGDEIIAGPNTITGSIGVIGGWIYDKGISSKLGMTSDYVSRGAHADLFFGAGLPGLRIPARNLTDKEHERMKEIILKYYDSFVKKVAEARSIPESEVRRVGEGQYYSGLDGLQNGLIDNIGGMLTAVAIAKDKAGLKIGQEVEIVELQKYRGLFHFAGDDASFEQKIKNSEIYKYIKMYSEQPGQPLPMMIPGTYPTLE